jgi:hypothetical protein
MLKRFLVMSLLLVASIGPHTADASTRLAAMNVTGTVPTECCSVARSNAPDGGSGPGAALTLASTGANYTVMLSNGLGADSSAFVWRPDGTAVSYDVCTEAGCSAQQPAQSALTSLHVASSDHGTVTIPVELITRVAAMERSVSTPGVLTLTIRF